MTATSPSFVAGVDGCRAGWIAVLIPAKGLIAPQVMVTSRFADILDHSAMPAIVAVDMPIGLPERIGPEGRGPERAIRPLLGARQSSVFAVPSRAAVYAGDYGAACAAAQATSTPPKKVSKQCFHLFPKMREMDGLITPELESRVYEVHPELAFWRLNGERAMSLPKTIRSAAARPGIEERQRLLETEGFEAHFLATVPRGAGADDLLDAAASALIARRIDAGLARPFPKTPMRDGRGLRMAIWA